MPILLRMRLLRRVAVGLGCGLLAVLLAGCGGFAASPSVSPASFLIPGLIQNTAPQPVPDVAAPSGNEVAVASLRN